MADRRKEIKQQDSGPWRIFTVDEAAEFLQLTPRTIQLLLKQKKIPGRKIGKSWRISELALNQMFDEALNTVKRQR